MNNQFNSIAALAKTHTGRTFTPKDLPAYFKNVQQVENTSSLLFRVMDAHGNDTGMITYLGSNEWRVYVDNFPGEKKYFQWNLPIKSLDDFGRDISRTGLILVPVDALSKTPSQFFYPSVDKLIQLVNGNADKDCNFGFPQIVDALPEKMKVQNSELDGIEQEWVWQQSDQFDSYWGELAYQLDDGRFLVFPFSG